MSSDQTVFISYRRDDSAGWAGRLQSDLRSRLGPDVRVFMDIDGIPAGEDFARAIDSAVGRCDVLVALIGPGWITAQDADGRRRLEDPNDFVRIEIEAALRRDIRVIPALVGDASLPRQDALPEPLRELIKRQAVKLNNDTWSLGISRLVKAIEPTSGTDAPPRLRLSANRLDFGVLAVRDDPPRTTVQISNAGGGELNAVATTTDRWIVVRNRTDAADVLVDTASPGEYVGRVTVSSAGGTSNIAVTATVKAESLPQSAPSASTPSPRWYQQGWTLVGGLVLGAILALAVVLVILVPTFDSSARPEVAPAANPLQTNSQEPTPSQRRPREQGPASAEPRGVPTAPPPESSVTPPPAPSPSDTTTSEPPPSPSVDSSPTDRPTSPPPPSSAGPAVAGWPPINGSSPTRE